MDLVAPDVVPGENKDRGPFLRGGVNANARQRWKNHVASDAILGKTEIVHLLLEPGVNANA